MTTTDKPTLAEALDKEIQYLNERAATIIKHLQQDAALVASGAQRITGSVAIDDLTDFGFSMQTVRSVIAYQARLDEIRKLHDALVKIRETYA